jgi:hypothetical protein
MKKKCHSIKVFKKSLDSHFWKSFLTKVHLACCIELFSNGCPFKSAKTFSMLRFNTKVFHLTFNIKSFKVIEIIRRSQLHLRQEFRSEFLKNSMIRWSFPTGIPTKSRLLKNVNLFLLAKAGDHEILPIPSKIQSEKQLTSPKLLWLAFSNKWMLD